MSIDHVLYVAPDLMAAADRLRREYGLDAVEGGAHPKWGTGNLIIPLGDHYIELFGIVDKALAATNDVGRWLTAACALGEGPRAVCLRSTDFEADAARLGIDIEDGERVYTDGQKVIWRQAGVIEAMATGMPAFLFDWPPESLELRLGRRPPVHAQPMAGIASVTIAGPAGHFPNLGPEVEFVVSDDVRLANVVIAAVNGSVFDLNGPLR